MGLGLCKGLSLKLDRLLILFSSQELAVLRFILIMLKMLLILDKGSACSSLQSPEPVTSSPAYPVRVVPTVQLLMTHSKPGIWCGLLSVCVILGCLGISVEMVCTCCYFQLSQAKSGKFNPHVHVEYEWNLRQEEMDESDDDLDDKVSVEGVTEPHLPLVFHLDRQWPCSVRRGNFGLVT